MDEEKHLFLESKRKSSSTYCKVIIVIAICVPILLFLAAVGGIFFVAFRSGGRGGSVCSTPSCVMLAATVLSNMNTTVDPCEDFYNYSCGGWVARNRIPSGHGTWGVFQELNQQNQIYIEKLITGPVDDSIPAIKLSKQLYSSCMDINELDELGATPMLDLLNRTGGWDLVGVHNGM